MKGNDTLEAWHHFDKSFRMVNSSKFLLLFDLTHPMYPIRSWTQTAKVHITNDASILLFFIFFIPNHVKEYLAFLWQAVVKNYISLILDRHIYFLKIPSYLLTISLFIVLDNKKILIFVSQLSYGHPCYGVFNDVGFLIEDEKPHLMSALRIKKMLNSKHSTQISCVVDLDIWHGRLSHSWPKLSSKFFCHTKNLSQVIKSCWNYIRAMP